MQEEHAWWVVIGVRHASEAENLGFEDMARGSDVLICFDLFDLQHRRPGLKRRRSSQNNKYLQPELRSGLYGIRDGRERGKRPRIGSS